ncbi:anthrone oxygenase family protein [Hymenobacter volaticus]|uniref:DUF1772 domain-containing protein n=1 Tax=Hymenobacter volaticus TaxID=2932254 RepID=A0ABY4GBA1_9BACT|nr:anthrone oxygenase family protein [Hymenobacter volaticus]UOQ68041.1 DUF1772 domain-containing protein [Hymenobacter volaticus]
MRGSTFILALATVTTALVAGVFYGFSVSVNLAFAHLPDAVYIQAMQAINEAIVNPIFASAFFGAPALLPLATVLQAHRPFSRRFVLLTGASVIYLVGGLGVTVVGNIPLNETLAKFPLATASPKQVAAARLNFAGPWNTWHTVRTLASTTALALVVGACLSTETATRKKVSRHSNQYS